jgi:hypothetical protein
LRFGKAQIMQPDWQKALSPPVVKQACELIVQGKD